MSFLYELKNIEQYYDGKRVLNIEHLTLKQNQIVGFFGPNGSGKSTLFSLLSFIDKPAKGEIYFNETSSLTLNSNIKQDVVLMPQNPYLLKRTVFDNIAYGLKIRGKDNANLEELVFESLSLVGLDKSFCKRKWSQLSGGEAQRVALASRLILKPKVLILDEPTSGVDTNSAQLIKEAILSAKQKYKTTIFISSHDHNWLNHICDDKVALFQGGLTKNGSVNLLFAPWKKDEDGNLVKYFLNDQKIVIPNSKNKKRDSVVMIESDVISICHGNCKHSTGENFLYAILNSISKEQSEDELLAEFSIDGISFNCKIDKNKFHKEKFTPGDTIKVDLNLDKVCWI